MSSTAVEVVAIESVQPHPNADRLEVATVNGAPVVVGKGEFTTGQEAAYFPPGIMIPDALAGKLGVTKYLKHAEFSPGEGSSQCRVAGCRLRGQPSFGFLADMGTLFDGSCPPYKPGYDITHWLGAKKYTPPIKLTCSDAETDCERFHKYTEIENYHRFKSAIPEGLPVRITEKIHGTNCRVGLIGPAPFQFMAGSHRLRRKKPIDGSTCPYWEPLGSKNLLDLLDCVSRDQHDVILFGEVFGPGVQDMDYGVPRGRREFRVFDLSIDGVYQGWETLSKYCEEFALASVPLLYKGPFHESLVEEYTYGATTLGTPQSAFKGREGIVITPLVEQYSLGGQRLILKSVSADYLDRKNAEDNE